MAIEICFKGFRKPIHETIQGHALVTMAPRLANGDLQLSKLLSRSKDGMRKFREVKTLVTIQAGREPSPSEYYCRFDCSLFVQE
jgi:hypothetical protein